MSDSYPVMASPSTALMDALSSRSGCRMREVVGDMDFRMDNDCKPTNNSHDDHDDHDDAMKILSSGCQQHDRAPLSIGLM
ncbi:hypothetical protein [Phaffia rhodozyma]|uniref:Uncharacterized protein n=1 Tax=Phaffia rhodozyma TaxID=264483 RepID=A0A0F7SV32_PHARH|nr:hypothetical protein [Phaffia rhodozyma]